MSFTTPPNDACLKGSNLAFKNAKMHLESAELLAKNNMYGVQSHLVLSTEEATKAIILLFRYANLGINQKTLQQVMSRHGPRHGISMTYELTSLILNKFLSGEIDDSFFDIDDKDKKREESKNLLVQITEQSKRILTDETYGKEFNPIFNWWKEADLKKNRLLCRL